MIKLFINSSDQSSYLEDGSISITEQIQNMSDTAYFSLMPGATQPSENEAVEIFDCVEIVSLVGTALTVKNIIRSGLSVFDYGKFRQREHIWLGVGAATEERACISDIYEDGSNITITLSDTPVSAHSAGQLAGKKVFGGIITYVKQTNPKLLSNVEYQISCTDYTKLFDKKLVNDSWEDKDARYIINDALNTTINYNNEIDDMDYVDDSAVQAEWIESGDGSNPTKNTTKIFQGTSSVNFPFVFAGGTATFTASPSSFDASGLTGVSTGSPTKGNISFWYNRASASNLTAIRVRIGSDASNYTQVSLTPESGTEDFFASLPLKDGTTVGTPNWLATDYVAILFIETANGTVIIDDLRMTADGSFTMFNFEETLAFDDVRASFKKPTVLIQSLADTLSYYWYIDYDHDIHFFDTETNDAPFDLDDTGDVFENLEIDVDTSQLKNRQVIRGGTKTSENYYTQVVQGDNTTREWVMKSLFESLEIWLDNNTSTDTMEAATTTTTVKATAHGLVDDDWIVNRTRSAARQITYVDPDTFTVLAVTGQTVGDSFSKFATTQTVGVENLVDETLYDYVSNYNEKSIRATSVKGTLTSTEYLLFKYKEVIPIRTQVSDGASIAALKTLGLGDGIFDGAVITDESLDSSQAVIDRGMAEISVYANPIVTARFKTDFEGLRAGQQIRITDTAKGIDNEFVIQKIRIQYKSGDYPTFQATCSTSLFGIIEYFQELSRNVNEREIDEDEVIDQLISDVATITISSVDTFTPTHQATGNDTITVSPSDSAVERDMTTDPYLWQPDASDARWGLAQWGVYILFFFETSKLLLSFFE